jgi:hypothetical protein
MPTQVADLYGKVSARIDDAQRNLRSVQGDLEKTGRQFDETGQHSEEAMTKAGDSTRGLEIDVASLARGVGAASAIIVGFGIAAKKAFDLSEEGAQLRQLEESFRTTGVSIEQMRASARGTVSDADLMAQSMNLLTGTTGDLEDELSAALPSLLEIAKASNKMNPTLGDTSFLLESIAEGVKRGSALRIDNAGIILSQAEASERYAEKLGVSADALTEEQEKIALLHETLRQGETIIEQAGKNVDSYADSHARLRTQIQNARADFKMAFSEFTEPVIGRIADTAEGYNYMSEVLHKFPFKRLRMINLILGGVDPKLQAQIELTARALEAGKNASEDYADGMMGVGRESKSAADGIEQVSFAVEDYGKFVDDAAGASADMLDRLNEQWDAAAKARQAAQVTWIYDAAQSDLGDTLFENGREVRALRQEQDQLLEQIRELEQQHGRVVTVQNKSALSTHELALARMDLAEAQEEMAEAEPDSRAFHQAAQDVAELEAKIGGAVGSTSALIDKSDDIAALREAYQEAGQGVDELREKSQELLNQQMLEELKAQFGRDDVWNKLELQIFEGFAQRTGQWDQTWVQMQRPIIEATEKAEGFEGGLAAAEAQAEQMVTTLVQGNRQILDEFGLLEKNTVSTFDPITTGADEARGRIDSLVGVAIGLNTELDKMERDITIRVGWDVDNPPTITGGGQIVGGDHQTYADGGFLPAGRMGYAGEEGIEAIRALSGGGVQVVPLRGSGGNGGGGGGSRGGSPVNINIYGGDLAEVRRVVEGVLIDQGIVSYHGLRG